MIDLFPLESNAGETEADICRDITLLSALLEDYRHGKSTLSDAKQTGGSSSDIWSHVSYVLAPGSSSETHGSNVVAVVGRVEPGSIVATVVAPNTYSENARPKPVEVDQVDLLGIDEVADMLNNLIETLPDDVEFDVHLRDVMSIVSYLLQKHETRLDKAVSASYLFDFIVLRCHRKLYARLVSGITLCTQHPLEALRDFHEKLSTAKAPGSTSTASAHQSAVGPDSPLCAKMPLAYMYTSLLKKHGITYDKDESRRIHVTFSSSNALNWAKLLCTIYDTLSKTVLDNNAREVRVARRPATTRELRDLQSALALLDDVIDTEIIQHLFHGDLVQQLNEQYSEFMGDKTQPRLARAISRADKTNPGDDSKIEYHHDADDLKADAEDTIRHIIRHLRALTAPLRAAIHIVNSCLNAPPEITMLNAYSVSVAPGSGSQAVSGALRKVHAWLEILTNSGGAILNLNASDVHAEAALMSLVSVYRELEVEVSGKLTPIASLLPSGPIPIAVSERCCFCCWLLAQFLEPGSGVAAQSGCVLRGTHSTIIPWSPSQGVPRAILEIMRKTLLDILVKAFVTSAQTDPATTSVDDDDDEPPPDTDLWERHGSDIVLPPMSGVHRKKEGESVV